MGRSNPRGHEPKMNRLFFEGFLIVIPVSAYIFSGVIIKEQFNRVVL